MISVVCNNYELMKNLEMVNVIVNISHIALPVLLFLLAIIKFFKTFKSMDDRIVKDGRKKAIRNILLAIFIYYLPNIAYYVNDLLYKDQESLIICLQEASPENMRIVEKKVEEENYLLLQKTVERIKTEFDIDDYEKAFEIINKINPSEKRNQIKEELELMRHYIDIRTEIRELEQKFSKSKYRKLYAEINELDDENYMKILMDKLLELEEGTPLDVTSGLSLKKFNDMTYYEMIPESPTTKLPLVIYLNGDEEFSSSNNVISYYAKGYGYNKEHFIFIAPNPNSYNNEKKWNDNSIKKDLKKLIDQVITEYGIDTKRIIIAGYGEGGMGTWDMLHDYPNFFSAAVPISSPASDFNAAIIGKTEIWAIAGELEEDNVTLMEEYVTKIKEAGGNAIFTKSKGKSFSKMNNAFANKEVINWALGKKLKTS